LSIEHEQTESGICLQETNVSLSKTINDVCLASGN